MVGQEGEDEEETAARAFEGVYVELPFVTLRAGRGGLGFSMGMQDDDPYRLARRRVRARLGFYRGLATSVAIVGGLALLDWATGGGWWVQWLAGIWGALLIWQFLNTFAFPSLWGREAEQRMIEKELRRQQGR